MSDSNTDLQVARKNFVDHLKKLGRSTATILAYNKDVDQLIQFIAQDLVSWASCRAKSTMHAIPQN